MSEEIEVIEHRAAVGRIDRVPSVRLVVFP
jgi:hypothetical protein